MKTNLDTLRKNSNVVLRLPEQARQVLDKYLQLEVDGLKIACPYHINPGLRSLQRVLLGKGNPKEIETFAAQYFERQGMYTKSDTVRLRAFMRACGLGIDCSGFAAWVLNGLTQSEFGHPLWKYLTFSGSRAKLVGKLRPLENISARLLTNERNARAVNELTKVRPGDLIRAANGHHVLVIVEAGLDASGSAHYFRYAQSSCMYGEESGVRAGHAVIRKPQGALLEQQWFDNYHESIVEELIAEGGSDSKVVRLKAFTNQLK